ELNATQRVLQSTLGRSTLMFRPPYSADAEPSSADEVTPILDAAALGYVTVGEYLDPQDWRLKEADGSPRTADAIARAVVSRVLSGHGNTILLHDGGGDWAATVAALKRFVPELEARGFRFVPVSELAGRPRATVMPAVSPRDRALLGGDRLAFELLWLAQVFLHAAFLAGIALGAARVLFVSVLALAARWRERRPAVPAIAPEVSVLIAAYNEGPVIARTLDAVLASRMAP